MNVFTLEIAGMTCGHCVTAVERALEEAPHVEPKNVAIGSATIATDNPTDGLHAAKQAIEEAGFTVVADQP
jgi:copper chaperone